MPIVFHRKIDVFVLFVLPFGEQADAELVAPNDCVLISGMVLGEQNLGFEVKDLAAKVVITSFLATIQLSCFDLERILYALHVLHIVVFELAVAGAYLRLHVQIGRLAVEVVFLNHMHRVVVAACKNIQTVRVFAIALGSLRWHLEVKSIKYTLRIIRVLKLDV